MDGQGHIQIRGGQPTAGPLRPLDQPDMAGYGQVAQAQRTEGAFKGVGNYVFKR